MPVSAEEISQEDTPVAAPGGMGFVAIVGAGCGKDLITVGGLRALRRAEVVLYDELLDEELLSQAGTEGDALSFCERIPVGKRAGQHSRDQEEIHELLIRKAREGKFVVRLKGGDPFVFGRGGEECLALEEAGIPYEVFPGVSSAIAAAESAGIPVTHRGIARSFTVVTGHSADGAASEDFAALASLRGTLVFLMGIGRLAELTDGLLAAGKDPHTPAAVISNGCSEQEKRIGGTLGDIAHLARDAETPGILVVGEVARLHLKGGREDGSAADSIFSGKRVVVTGTADFARRYGERLRALGATVFLRPNLKIIPQPERIPPELSGYDWIAFQSGNGIRIFFDEIRRRGADLRLFGRTRFSCIGRQTAELLMQYGFHTDLIPEASDSAHLGSALAAAMGADERALILRAQAGAGEILEILDRAGRQYDSAELYRTEELGISETAACACSGEAASEASGSTSAPLPDDTDFIVFGSASGVRAFAQSPGFDPDFAGEYAAAGHHTAEEIRKQTGRETVLLP